MNPASPAPVPPAGANAARAPVRIAWPHIVLAIAGAAVSLVAFLEHRVVAAGGSACGISDTISCDRVLSSHYAVIFGIPLGIYGMAFFALVAILAVSTAPAGTPARNIVLPRLALATAGLAGSVALTLISVLGVHAVCPICLTTHAVVALNFVVAATAMFRARSGGYRLPI